MIRVVVHLGRDLPTAPDALMLHTERILQLAALMMHLIVRMWTAPRRMPLSIGMAQCSQLCE